MCGDPFHGPIQNQPGPDNVYALGVITATYTEADEFTAKVQVCVMCRLLQCGVYASVRVCV